VRTTGGGGAKKGMGGGGGTREEVSKSQRFKEATRGGKKTLNARGAKTAREGKEGGE